MNLCEDYCRDISSSISLFLPEVTNVEGILRRTIAGLQQDQAVRRVMAPDDADKIDAYVKRIEDLLTVSQPFHLVSLQLACLLAP